MATNAKEFIDFWLQNSVHAKLDLGQLGSSQIAADLAARLLIAAKDQGLSEDEVRVEIGDPIAFFRSKLGEARRMRLNPSDVTRIPDAFAALSFMQSKTRPIVRSSGSKINPIHPWN